MVLLESRVFSVNFCLTRRKIKEAGIDQAYVVSEKVKISMHKKLQLTRIWYHILHNMDLHIIIFKVDKGVWGGEVFSVSGMHFSH